MAVAWADDRRAGDGVEPSGRKTAHAKDVIMLGSDAIHSVQNKTREWTAALHVYGGDFFANPRLQWHKVTGEPEPFDVATRRLSLPRRGQRPRESHYLIPS